MGNKNKRLSLAVGAACAGGVGCEGGVAGRDRSYGVNTGGLYDLYRRPKLVVETVRELFKSKPED